MYSDIEGAAKPAAEICERIWLSIAERRLRPGTRLKEEQLAEIFAVSRARIRQALAVLEGDGLVTILPNRGAFVAEPSIEEARDVFHVRKFIEARVIERLLARTGEADIPRLEAHLEEERAANARGDTSAAIRLSGGFHLLLAELSGSDFLLRVLHDLVSRSSLITAVYRNRDGHNCGPDDHGALIRSIAEKDSPRAQATMREHLDHVEAELDLDTDLVPAADLRQALIGPTGMIQ